MRSIKLYLILAIVEFLLHVLAILLYGYVFIGIGEGRFFESLGFAMFVAVFQILVRNIFLNYYFSFKLARYLHSIHINAVGIMICNIILVFMGLATWFVIAGAQNSSIIIALWSEGIYGYPFIITLFFSSYLLAHLVREKGCAH